MGASGLANLAIFEGRLGQAVQSLEKGAAADLVRNERDAAADKFVLLAYAEMLRGNTKAAVAAAILDEAEKLL